MNSNNIPNEIPAWFNANKVSETLDAREMLQAGEHPLAEVMNRTSGMQPGQIFELITPFKPKPLIEKIAEKGFNVYVNSDSDLEFHTYFLKV
jgi:uncharacterized protein (DUF2249 family)